MAAAWRLPVELIGSLNSTRSPIQKAYLNPYVIRHLASGVDGRISPSRWRPLGIDGDLYERLHTQYAAQAWLIGRVTGQEFAKAKAYPHNTSNQLPREPWLARHDASTYAVVLDAQGKIAWGRSDIGGDPILVVLTEAVSDAHLAGFRADKVSYFFGGETSIDLARALDFLKRELGVDDFCWRVAAL